MDARGRKQYRYHPLWHEHAGNRKFSLLPEFATALPAIRARVKRCLSSDDLSRDRVIAGIVALLDATGFRIGNRRYARENGSYGLSSLLAKHMKEEAGEISFHFRGKSGLDHEATIASPGMVKLLLDLQDLPGQRLFRYEGEDGCWHDVETADINAWLKETGGGDFTAKQFRTWRATVSCARRLGKNPPPQSKSEAEKEIRAAIRETAASLNHTVATCRKYYIHPAIPAAFRTGEIFRVMQRKPPGKSPAGLTADERRIFPLLRSYRLRMPLAYSG